MGPGAIDVELSVDLLVHAIFDEPQRLHEHEILAAEVVHDVARTHARPIGDVGDAGRREPAIGDDGERGFHHALPTFAASIASACVRPIDHPRIPF